MTPSAAIDAKWRVALGTISLGGLLLLVMARMLEPDLRGYGTHEQLGLTPCTFQETTGMVCPACGSTTAWAYATRGRLGEAVEANLGGTVLALFVVVVAPWGLLVAATGKWLLVQPTLPVVLITASAWAVVALLDWLRRIYFS